METKRLFTKKYRIAKRSTKDFGVWFVLQKRKFFRWEDLPRIFKTFNEAAYAVVDYSISGEVKPEEKIETTIEF